MTLVLFKNNHFILERLMTFGLRLMTHHFRPQIAFVTVAATLLAACGESTVCSKSDVLSTVQQLFEKKEFGGFTLQPGVVNLKTSSATYRSTDDVTKVARCSVMISVDLIEILRQTQGFNDEQINQARTNASRNGQATSVEELISYTVETMSSGEQYVTVLR